MTSQSIALERGAAPGELAYGAPAPDGRAHAASARDKRAGGAPAPDQRAHAVSAPDKQTRGAPAPDQRAHAVSASNKQARGAPAPDQRVHAVSAPDKQARGAPARDERAAGQAAPSKLLGLLLPVAALLAAEAGVRAGLVPANLLPAPSEIVNTISQLAQNGLAGHVAASAARVAIGFAAGATLAILLGVAVGLNRRAENLLDPSFQALRAIPSLAWVPLLLLWLGIDEAPKLVLIAIGAFFPVYMGVASGIRGVDRKLVEVARIYRLGRVALARRVLLPAALPAILTGLRNGLSLAWMFMVAAELIAASQGLGYLLSDGRETSRADIVLAAIALLAILGKVSDSLMASLENHLLAWRDNCASPV